MRVVAELIDFCNLKCTLCWNRNRVPSGKQMSIETVEKVLQKYNHPENEIAWFNWGDPLLYDNLEELSEMVKNSKCKTAVSSSLSMRVSDERMESLHNFGTVCVSLSGMTSDVYGIYHRNGNFELVMENLSRMSGMKNIKLKWLGHKYNEHQKEEAKEYANKMGFKFEVILLNCEVEDHMNGFTHELLNTRIKQNRFCRIRYWDLIDTEGNYLLCCASHNVKIGYSIDDNVSRRKLREARSETSLCQRCTEMGYWRMY